VCVAGAHATWVLCPMNDFRSVENFMFESNIEMRINHFRGMGKLLWLDLDNIWMVYFADVGNVWEDVKNFQFKDLAAATGLGFRYDTYFGPFRIDYGFRLYDPKAPAGKQSIFQKRFWADTFSNGVLQLWDWARVLSEKLYFPFTQNR